jgi:hypothetical protein
MMNKNTISDTSNELAGKKYNSAHNIRWGKCNLSPDGREPRKYYNEVKIKI